MTTGQQITDRKPRNADPFSWPGLSWMGEEERALVLRALDPGSGWEPWEELKQEVCERLGTRCCGLTNSGTSALAAGLAALDVGPGDEVLVPGFMWIATAAAVVTRGAIPVLVEVDDTFTMDPEDIQARISPRTRAVIPVHMCGACADMDPILRIAQQHGLRVLEDCSQACGVTYRGRFVGTLGDIGAFSLQRNKLITAFSGGFFVTDDAKMFEKGDLVRGQGVARVMETSDRPPDEQVTWGEGRGMNPLACAVALAQFRKMKDILDDMQRKKEKIRRGLSDIPGLEFRRVVEGCADGGSFLVTVYPDTATAVRFAEALKKHGAPQWTYRVAEYGMHVYSNIHALVRRVPVHLGSGYPWSHPLNAGSVREYGPGALPRSDALFARSVVMAVPALATGEQTARIIDAYHAAAQDVLR